MKMVKASLILGVFACAAAFGSTGEAATTPGVTVERNPVVIHQQSQGVSAPLSEIVRNLPPPPPESRIMIEPGQSHAPVISNRPDPVVQRVTLPALQVRRGLNFAGVGQGDYGYSDSLTPPDTNASVGDTQVVQFVNDSFAVFNKATGALVLGPAPGGSFWSGLGGSCAAPFQGDIIIKYDQLANRWVALQLAFESTPYLICVAVSQTSDATGVYNQYSLNYGFNLPDYPKLSVWPDAYYMNVNLGGGPADSCALDRTAMLNGQPMTAQCFEKTSESTLLPSDVDGSGIASSGEPAFFVDLYSSTQLHLYKFHVDFNNPANTTFTGPTAINIASYTMACANGIGFEDCIQQPNTSNLLETLSDRLMYRLAYRNFGSHESLLVTHSVKPGKGMQPSGIRWYEIQNPNGTPTVAQQGTFANGKAALWMGSIASDKAGDFAMGFSAASSAVFPSIVITGRLPIDPPGTMESPKILKKGTGSQTSIDRWGDYSSMALDPSDDCTFWYTTEYLKTTSGAATWSTQLASFKFPTCQ